jgi:hypothetical protein
MVARQPCVLPCMLTPADISPASYSGKNSGDAMLLVPFESALGSALTKDLVIHCFALGVRKLAKHNLYFGSA